SRRRHTSSDRDWSSDVCSSDLGVLGCPEIDAIEAGTVAAKDRLLGRAIGAAQSREAVFLAHILRDLEPAHGLDLPLRRAVPQGRSEERCAGKEGGTRGRLYKLY